MLIRGKLFEGILIALAISLIPVTAIAAQKVTAGSNCKVMNQKVVYFNKTYTCVKSRKKLIWNKGVKVAPAPTPTKIAAPFVAKIPITLPVAQTGEITFSNAVAKFASIPQVAWQRVQDVIAANSEVNIETALYIGPTTGTTKELVLPVLQKAYRLFQGFSQPSTYFGLIYNGKDEPWAEKQLEIILSAANLPQYTPHFLNIMRGGCDLTNASEPSCSSGNSLGLYPTTGGGSLYGVQEPYWSGNGRPGADSQVTHEYTHNVQFAQWTGAPLGAGQQNGTDAAHSKMPCWFQEGQANAIGTATWAPDLKTYTSGFRNGNIARALNPNLPKPSLTTFTAASFEKFLYEQDPLTCYDPSSGDYQLGYSVGYAAVEALIAIGGPQSTMALLTKMADGDSWSSAFQHVYGITWEQGAAVLGQILAAEYAVLPVGSGG